MSSDRLSYKPHDGIELKLMLAKKKPLAFFMHSVDEENWFQENVEFKFKRYIESGRLLKFTTKTPAMGVDMIIYAYTLPNEEWRANALFLLMTSFLKCKTKLRWSEGMERMLGTLLGYDDEQNDEFVEKNIASYM